MEKKKEYRSAIRSRRLIREAFLELLKEKKFEKITVTDIVSRADINRSTFYAHYPDVVGLVEEMMEDVIRRSLELTQKTDFQTMFADPTPFLRELTAISADNLDIYRLLGQSDFALHQMERVKTDMVARASATMAIPEEIRGSTAFRIQLNFFIGGILNTYQRWLQGSLDCSMEEITACLAQLIRGMKPLYSQMQD